MNEFDFANSENNERSDKTNIFKTKVPVIDSLQLFGKGNEIMIQHDGAIYRLRITKNGKLIMNK